MDGWWRGPTTDDRRLTTHDPEGTTNHGPSTTARGPPTGCRSTRRRRWPRAATAAGRPAADAADAAAGQGARHIHRSVRPAGDRTGGLLVTERAGDVPRRRAVGCR